MSGKGSAPRPFSVSNEEYANRWDAIFGRVNDTGKEKEVPPQPAQFDTFCNHDVWTHNGERYECMGCGAQSEAGPYTSR
jgi:hypothetical protein